ncbi:protein kinase domain-containing protein [Rickettsiella endosymbiont of Rhagonycha lignosa]|uniref:protein kinase domain-containing protein n=1 Tax=Rickettsiella endosymbiont of Rhagonycha lignosa TaxID=3077937 RepID=UPI00313D9FD5
MYRNKHKLSLTLLPVDQKTMDCNLDTTSFVPEQNIVNIKQGKLCLPDDLTDISFVQKKGKKTILSEIKIYKLIASNKQSKKKAIIRPISNASNESSLILPFMSGRNLDFHHYFLFEQFEKKSIASIWLMKQLFLLLEALCHLHTETFILENQAFKGIIHGDIKSSNILINELGNLVLADFDCAYSAGEPAHQFGSLRYVAPELFANMDFTKIPILNVDKSDIWSLGATLYRLLNNKFPTFFNDFTLNQKKVKLNFFQEELDKNNYCDLKDNIDCFIDLKKWGENYSSSSMAKNARESLKILQEIIDKELTPLTPREILNYFCFAMLTPVEERPCAQTLLNLRHGLEKHFCAANDEEYQQFITALLNHSLLNVEENVKKTLIPEKEPHNKKNRIFS